jgi:hypothetical protein
MPRLCHICAIRSADSDEHLPGVAAANDGPVEVIYIEPGRSADNQIKFRRVIEREGFSVPTLCQHCNARTGGSYGTAYKDFVRQFSLEGLSATDEKGRALVALDGLQPLRVLKQMTAMFLAAQPKLDYERWRPLREFVLRKDARLPAGQLSFFVYKNVAKTGRIVPMTALGFLRPEPKPAMAVFSELSWPPVGIVFAMEPHPLLANMADVTHWGEYRFKDRVSLALYIPNLRVETHWPLGFGTPSEVDRWTEREHVIHFVAEGSDDPDLPTNVGLLFRKTDL